MKSKSKKEIKAIIARKRAKDSLVYLVKHVFKHSSDSLVGITYQDLAKRIRYLDKNRTGHAHGMGHVLGNMRRLLNDLSDEWGGEYIPHIQSLVVRKNGSLKGLPGPGIADVWSGYPEFTERKQLKTVRAEYVKIAKFGSRWNRVLSSLKLHPQNQVYQKGSKYGRGGESPEHKGLKIFVSKNPKLVEANKGDKPVIEYSFPSLDAVDVLFKNKKRWIGVEVKSRISPPKDYERGLYQCVKYYALLKAMKKESHYKVPKEIKVVLLLEKTLPKKYKQVAKKLKIKVIENIKPTGKKV